MASTTDNLTSLPNDVFTAITSDFDLADLGSLRLTSHNLHVVATTPDFRTRFHNIRTDLSEDSLHSLIAICSSPDLGHLIKEVTVLAKHYDAKELEDQLQSGTRWEAQAVPAPFSHSVGHKLTGDEKDEVKILIERMVKLKEEQAAVQTNGEDVYLLAKALSHLGARSISISIEAAVHTRPQGSRQSIRKCRDTNAMSQTMDHAARATFGAVAKTQLRITNPDIFNLQWGGFVSMNGLHEAFVVGPYHVELASALSHLRSLNINLKPAPVKQIGEEQHDPYDQKRYPIYGPASEPKLHDAYLSSLAALLRPMAHSLKRLEIRFRGWHAVKLDCAEVFAFVAGADLGFAQLSELHLNNVVMHGNDLIKILQRTPVLTHLGLHKVSLPKAPHVPEKMVEYPNSSPEWSQMEPDIEGWKDAWQHVFDALITPDQATIGDVQTGSNDSMSAPRPCPRLEALEINALYLASFEHRIYFTAPHTALSRYVHDIMSDDEKFKSDWFKLQTFQEGLACCVFNGNEVRGEDKKRSPEPAIKDSGDLIDLSEPQDQTQTPQQYPNRNQLYVPLAPPPTEPEPRGIHYKISTTRPLGSPALYQWIHGWDDREFSEKGCDPEAKAANRIAPDTGPVSSVMVTW